MPPPDRKLVDVLLPPHSGYDASPSQIALQHFAPRNNIFALHVPISTPGRERPCESTVSYTRKQHSDPG